MMIVEERGDGVDERREKGGLMLVEIREKEVDMVVAEVAGDGRVGDDDRKW